MYIVLNMKTIPMIYPSHITWKVPLEGVCDPYLLFSAKTRKKLKSAYSRITFAGYSIKIEPVTPKLLDQFFPLYMENVLKKSNPNIKNIQEHIQKKMDTGRVYQSVSLYDKDGVLKGALLFAVLGEKLSAAYKVFPTVLEEVKLPISVTYVAEYKFFERAISLGKTMILHGMDSNVYGENSAIGLALFKLNIGGVPYLSSRPQCEVRTEYTWPMQQDVLIFHMPDHRQPIAKATLFLLQDDESSREKYRPVLTHEQIDCTVVTGS